MTSAANLLMAFDVGVKRIGVAIGNTLIRHAQALQVIHAAATVERFKYLDRLVHTWQPEAFVVGVPVYPDGNVHPWGPHCQRFGRRIAARFALPVHWVDERYSSVAAQAAGHHDALDAHAAAVILQHYFDQEAIGS